MPSLLDLYRRRVYPFNDFGSKYSFDDEPTDPFIGAYGSRALTGPPRGSPGGGLPQQAREASPFSLTRERAARELEDNPTLAQKLDANTTAEVGTDPRRRRGYQAATIDRAVQTGVPLEEVVNNPAYYPRQTTQATTTTGQGVDPSIWAGANPVKYATGNASYDPRTGRDVGFAGGPQTASIGGERYGIEGQEGVPYARAMGYTGPDKTPIGFGPGAPTGSDESVPLEDAPSQNYASALTSPQRRKMPDDNGLLSMFQPRDQGGAPIGFGDMLAQRQNSLIGLGLGLMAGTRQDPYGAAMRGYAQGASSDQDRYQTAQALARHKADQARAQANTDRSFAEQVRQFNLTAEGGKVPPGWTKGPDGGLAPIPGGPADPKYLQAANEAKAKPRELSVTDITKLSEEGGKFAQVRGFTDTFEPRFAGSKIGVLGDIRNLAGRNLPESVVGKDVAEGATWWQGYDNFKNVARHELYGGALTPTEVGVFEKANINPAMDPKQIEKNLAIQKEIVQNGLKRKANALIQSGQDPKVIAQAYGIPLEELGVTATGRRGTVAPVAGTPAPDKPAPDKGGSASAYDKARAAIKNGAPRDAVLKRLRDNGIDPAGL